MQVKPTFNSDDFSSATCFITTLFVGRGEFSKHTSATLAEARDAGRQMVSFHNNGRLPLIYAQMPNGGQILVPNQTKEADMPKTETTTTTAPAEKTYNKRFNAQRAAKAALGHDAFETYRADNGEWAWRAISAAAIDLPPAPDFSAKTHERYRGKLAAVVAMAEAGDVDGLRKFHINPSSTSPKAIMRYRDRAIAAITQAA